MSKFRKYLGLPHIIRCSDITDNDEVVVTKGREKVSALIPEYETADAYNMRESGIFKNQIKPFPVNILKDGKKSIK